MRCKTCDYPLWDLKARQCPECGAPFKPSDYEFTLNSVRFCCPHCTQAYYGNGPAGHLVPRTFACVACQAPLDMDQMVLLPAEGVQERHTRVAATPWAKRDGRGWFTSFFITMGLAISNPHKTIDGVPPSSSGRRAVAYMTIHVMLQAILGCWWFWAWIFYMMATNGRGGVAPGMVAAGVGVVVLAPAGALALMGLAHGVLRLTGPTAGGLPRTLHALCYSSGNNFFSGVPCLSFYLSWAGVLWWAIAGGFMLARAQRVHGARAAAAVVVPLLVAAGLAVGGISLALWSAGFAAVSAAPATAASNSARVQTIIDEVATRAPMGHAAEALADGSFTIGELYDPDDYMATSRMSTTTLGGLLGSQFTGQGAVNETGAAARAAQSLPAGTVAYRVGDTVFTNLGIDPTDVVTGDPAAGLWLVLAVRDPAAHARITGLATSTGAPAGYQVHAGRADGTVESFGSSSLPQRLAAQNTLRATFGLPPLSDPSTLLEAAPDVPVPGATVRANLSPGATPAPTPRHPRPPTPHPQTTTRTPASDPAPPGSPHTPNVTASPRHPATPSSPTAAPPRTLPSGPSPSRSSPPSTRS